MRWKAKAAVQKGLSLTPWAEQANYVLQTRVTKGLPQSDASVLFRADQAAEHVVAYEAHGRRPLGEVRVYEFGAGWDLVGPLTFWMLGVEQQVLVDIAPHVRWELINHSMTQLHRNHGELEQRVGRPLRAVDPTPIATTDELRARFGIDYRAPVDARATGLPAESFDLITSTFTLEHIPAADVEPIIAECARLLAVDGVLSFSVDMHDHYAFEDPSISVYNYLRYSDLAWRFVNSSLHHQNRLRSRDYLQPIERAGLDAVEVRAGGPDDAQAKRFASSKIASSFASRYSTEELMETWLNVVARRAA